MRNKPSVLLILLHNKNPKRLNLIRPKLKLLEKKLSSNYKVELSEIFRQPTLKPSSFWLTIYRRFIYWHINRQWEAYKLFKPRNLLVDAVLLLRRILLVSLDLNREGLKSKAEILSSAKHVAAWDMLVNKKMNYLICFEDDALFKKDSIGRIENIFKEVEKVSLPIVVNLGEGNPPHINRVQNLQTKKTLENLYYKKPSLNTACSYLINNKTATIFQTFLMENPLYRILAGDWLTNIIFINTVRSNKYFCFHPEVAIFAHGSLNGKFKSEISS